MTPTPPDSTPPGCSCPCPDEASQERDTGRPSLLMCCRGCARCALQVGQALHCPIHGTRFSATPPAPGRSIPTHGAECGPETTETTDTEGASERVTTETDDPLSALPPCCRSTVGMVQLLERDVRCGCGDWCFYDRESAMPPEREALVPAAPAVDVVAPHAPGPTPDARVQVADEDHLRPSTVPPLARITRVEDPELVRVRQLLSELRPDRGGPLGWAADGAPPAAGGSNWTPTLRVQTSVEVPAILPGAFASQAQESRAPRLDPSTTLGWLQRFGTLRAGLRALYADCAEACASGEARAKWKALAPRDQMAAAVVHGRRLVREAMAVWWRETPPVDAEALRSAQVAAMASFVAKEAERASAETTEALARVRGRVNVVDGIMERVSE